ncbi:MAG: hypothetical protein GY705_28150 [Bacteroidetes bacterium]|nr:hypothetical protein [Bacteroidota bacterium]
MTKSLAAGAVTEELAGDEKSYKASENGGGSFHGFFVHKEQSNNKLTFSSPWPYA